jgi:hypothetical protein
MSGVHPPLDSRRHGPVRRPGGCLGELRDDRARQMSPVGAETRAYAAAAGAPDGGAASSAVIGPIRG